MGSFSGDGGGLSPLLLLLGLNRSTIENKIRGKKKMGFNSCAGQHSSKKAIGFIFTLRTDFGY